MGSEGGSPYRVLVLKSVRQSLASASDVYIRTYIGGGGDTIPESVLYTTN